MTKKISCRVLDTTALCEDQPEVHLGWGFDTSIYTQTDQPQDNFTPRHPLREPYTAQNQLGQSIDCYA